VSPVTQITARAFGYRSPQMLPDGRHFLCFAGGADAGIHLGQLGEPTTRKILDATAAVYSPTGHLLFVRQGNLFSQPFDVTRLEVIGAPTLIAQNIVPGAMDGVAALAVSAARPIVYRTGGAGPLRQLMWVDRTGKQLDILSRIDRMDGIGTSLSADDAYVAWTRGPANIWLFELARLCPTIHFRAVRRPVPGVGTRGATHRVQRVQRQRFRPVHEVRHRVVPWRASPARAWRAAGR